MENIHNLVVQHGRLEARKYVTEDEWHLVDTAARVLEEESQALGITYSGFCMTSLPHRRLPDDAIWERKAAKFSLLVEPGYMKIAGQLRQVGIPYGSRARLILLYLQTRAVQTDSREVELGRSLGAWMDRMGVPIGGKNYQLVREQANRISACKLTFFWENEAVEGFEKDHIIKGGMRIKSPAEASVAKVQGSLWEDRVLLGETFFRAIKSHPVPLWEPALRVVANQSMTIDVYIWLAYRLRSLRSPTDITWTALHAQFGAGFQAIRQFKPKFIEALKMALMVYPDAKVQINERVGGGLTLHPSRPPVAESKALARR